MNIIKQVIYENVNPDSAILDENYINLNVLFVDENENEIAKYIWNDNLSKHVKE